MEFEVSAPSPLSPSPSKACDLEMEKGEEKLDKDRLRVKRKTLQTVLEQCQRALELLNNADGAALAAANDDDDHVPDLEVFRDKEFSRQSSLRSLSDREADELCDLLKSRVECSDFLEKLECAQASVPHEIIGEECSSWDMVNENDLWEGEMGHSEQEDFVLVRQEDIVDGIACFMAAYLCSLKQTKTCPVWFCTSALSKTFSVKKNKGKLRKAWDGSKVIYNVASWGATAIGIYQNPVILRAATNAFWTSCHIISKIL
ncbi:unnamed protein product [Linum tenue]|uniref:Uncharacterized protein n=1 Tax=Linum tenue TaxID=586396 RepID=A0AAV0PB87_9ROSI|nr:unnamed protein product [Linum tenue]